MNKPTIEKIDIYNKGKMYRDYTYIDDIVDGIFKLINKVPKLTSKKKIIPMIIGDIKFPKNIPNLNQILFNGVNNFEFKKPKIRKTIAMINDHILISFWFKIGQNATNENTKENRNPKLLFELILISL